MVKKSIRSNLFVSVNYAYEILENKKYQLDTMYMDFQIVFDHDVL